jgi:hypothetical protein
MQITVGNKKRYSITLVLGSSSDFPQSSSGFAISDCYSQSCQIRHRCQHFCWDLAGGLSMATCHDVPSTCLEFSYIRDCSIHKVVPIRCTDSQFLFSFNSYAPMHSRVTYHQIPLYVWALNQALAPSSPWWQSFFFGTLFESHQTCIFQVDVGLPSLNPILISLIRNHVELPFERALPMPFGGIAHSCSNH